MKRLIKTRKGRLENYIKLELNKDIPNYINIIKTIDSYQKDNTDTIDKLKKGKRVDMNKINGALKQTINAHGPITKELIGSASKRIHGSLLINPNQKKRKVKFSLRDIIIGILIGVNFVILMQII